jgi:hypothetical protein
VLDERIATGGQSLLDRISALKKEGFRRKKGGRYRVAASSVGMKPRRRFS